MDEEHLLPGKVCSMNPLSSELLKSSTEATESSRVALDAVPGPTLDVSPVRDFKVDCDFNHGGPWAGVKDLFSVLLPEMQISSDELLQEHAFELVQIMPQLRRTMQVRNPTLTDLATDLEKVRNYAADRAFRVVHGLIDMLDTWKSSAAPKQKWMIYCDGLDEAGVVCQRFFKELVRRRASKLNLRMIVRGRKEAIERLSPIFAGHPNVEFTIGEGVSNCFAVGSVEEARTHLKALESEVGNDRISIAINISRLISLAYQAELPDRVAHWRFFATAFYCNLGLYADALIYSNDLIEYAAANIPESYVLQWWTANKRMHACAGLGRVEEGLYLANEVAPKLQGFVDPILHTSLYYLRAMFYSRYQKPRDFVAGEACLDQALALIEVANIPDSEKAFLRVFNRNGVAMIRSFQGRHAEATALCTEGLEILKTHLQPNQHKLHRSILHFNIAQVYVSLQDYEEAIRYFGMTMEMDPNYSEYYNDRGNIYLRLGRFDDARADYLEAIRLSPPYFEVYTNLGQCYRAAGDMTSAVNAYSRSLDLEANQVLALLGRANAYEQMGNPQQAIDDYSAALALDPQQWEALGNRGVLHYFSGALDAAIADFSAAIALKPEEADLYGNRATALLACNRSMEATQDLQRAAELARTETERIEFETRLSDIVPKPEMQRAKAV